MKAIVTEYRDNTINIWRGPKEKPITDEDLINKYLEGYRDGIRKAETKLVETLERDFFTNLRKAQEIAETVYRQVNTEGEIIKRAYLGIIHYNSFKVLFVVDRAIFNTDKVYPIYQITGKAEDENYTPGFNIELSLLPDNGNINIGCLYSDGFSMHYDENPVKA